MTRNWGPAGGIPVHAPAPETSAAASHPTARGAEHERLAASQTALVAALVAGAPDPPGFATRQLAATRRALLRKRAGAAAAAWPLLAASLGADWLPTFTEHARGRDTVGALRDGWDLARALAGHGELGDGAAVELAEREVTMRYDGRRPPRRRRWPVARRAGGVLLWQLRGRVRQVPAAIGDVARPPTR